MLPTMDLFSGVGGFSLGLERTGGFKTVACAEIDPFCRDVLALLWPHAKIYTDVRWVSRHELARDLVPAPRVICGGFPCQDISDAGRRVGIAGERSGLWSHFARIIDEFRPDYAIVENVPALLRRGMGVVLGDLASSGYHAEWDVLGADDIGASQHRKRLWILAYPDDAGLQGPIWAGQSHAPWAQREAAYSEPLRSACGFWPPGPRSVADIPRMADGPANRTHRLKALGNTVVPQITELIGRAILAAEQSRAA